MTINWDQAFADRTSRMHASEIRDLLKVINRPGVISFAGGIPDPDLFPRERIAQITADILADPRTAGPALQYGISEGYVPLREWISGYMTEKGVPCAIENIVITTGSQQGLDFLGKVFIDPGDTVLVEFPTYLGALQAFNPYQPRYANLRNPATADASPVLGYVVPDFANPSGETLDRSERLALLAAIAELDVPLIEDAAYEALRYRGNAERSLLALDIERVGSIDASRVIYCGTFSKTVAPGFRVGWVCAARELVSKIVLAKQSGDLHSSQLNQMVVHGVVSEGFNEHLDRLRSVYGRRQETMLAALEEGMPEGVSWIRPDGGVFIWLQLPEGLDGTWLLTRALAEDGIAFVPGKSFFADGAGANYLRLNYTLASDHDIRDGVTRLGQLIHRQMSEQRASPTARAGRL